MARNGSGTYSLPAGNPVVSGTTISSTWANNTLSDIATALTSSIAKDGQTVPTANLPMGGFKFTNMAVGTASTDSARFDQIFNQGAPTDIASAATVDIGGQLTNFLNVTGTTTITSFGTNYKGPKMLKFTGILTLTYNATTLVIPGAANITTAAGDVAIVIPKSTTSGTADGWQVIQYQKASSLPAEAGVNSTITSLTGLTSPIPRANTISIIQSLPDPTLAANAMTLPASTHALDFRSATLGSGLPTTVTGTAAALVIPAGATLGHINAVQGTDIEVIMNNGGTLEKAVVNLAGGNDLSEEGVISTTAISAGATSANVFYSTTARSNLPYRVARKIVSTQSTAGQWATSPSLVQGMGGNALAAMSSLGYGQTWQSVTRTSGTTYYNTTGKPITAVITCANTSATFNASVDGFTVYSNPANQVQTVTLVIPPNSSYVFNVNLAFTVTELR